VSGRAAWLSEVATVLRFNAPADVSASDKDLLTFFAGFGDRKHQLADCVSAHMCACPFLPRDAV